MVGDASRATCRALVSGALSVCPSLSDVRVLLHWLIKHFRAQLTKASQIWQECGAETSAETDSGKNDTPNNRFYCAGIWINYTSAQRHFSQSASQLLLWQIDTSCACSMYRCAEAGDLCEVVLAGQQKDGPANTSLYFNNNASRGTTKRSRHALKAHGLLRVRVRAFL